MQHVGHFDGHHKVTKGLRSIEKSKDFRSATWLPKEIWMSYISMCFLACTLCFVSHIVTRMALSEGMQYTNTNRHTASIICLIKSFLFLEKVYKTDVLHRINNEQLISPLNNLIHAERLDCLPWCYVAGEQHTKIYTDLQAAMKTGRTWHHRVRINIQACLDNLQNSSVSLRKNPDFFLKWSLCTESKMFCYKLPIVIPYSAVMWKHIHKNVTSPFYYWYYTLTTGSESIALVVSIQNDTGF